MEPLISNLFFICRHGTTAGNAANKYRGWSNEPEARLSPTGRDVVREAALFLKKSGQKFPLIISDDLDRTVESRNILQDILQIPVAETDERLRPLNVGDFTGKSKTDHPIEKFTENKSLVIPGGESVNQFNKRMAEFFDTVAAIIEKLGPILIVGHGSTVSFLHNHFNKDGEVGYEGLTNPGGVSVFTSKGVVPLTRKREGASDPFGVGTATSGFVTDEENRPPRECWNCNWFVRNPDGLGGCLNPVVRVDPELVEQRQTDGTVAVGDTDCCNYFTNKVGS